LSDFEIGPETDIGRAMFEELLWIHGMIRRDLQTVQRLATEVAAALPSAQLQSEIKDLKSNGRLWQLKVGCLRYCHFVHSHHNLEDAAWFPAMRRANPPLEPVVDKLESDHRKVSVLLDTVEAAATTLSDVDSSEARGRVSEALTELAEHLLAHLDFEELNAGPTLRRMQSL
jgi:hypothetical protein